MNSNSFSCYQDDDDIWHLRFNQPTRAAVQEYIRVVDDLNAKIISGDIHTRNPVCILWDQVTGYTPQLHHMVVKSRLSPPPPELSYRIAYLIASKAHKLEIQAYKPYLNQRQVVRAYFLPDERDSAIQWLIRIPVNSQS